jgi:hypothetical protein
MNFLNLTKGGGPESTVWAYWLFEAKRFCSVALLRFEDGSRDAYHDHAFNSISWVLAGELNESRIGWDTSGIYTYTPSWRPILTRRTHLHKVTSRGRTWVRTFRGPWARTWTEWVAGRGRRLSWGRVTTDVLQ